MPAHCNGETTSLNSSFEPMGPAQGQRHERIGIAQAGALDGEEPERARQHCSCEACQNMKIREHRGEVAHLGEGRVTGIDQGARLVTSWP